MAYNPITPSKLIAFSASYVPVRTLLNFLVASQGTAFQTQAGRDSFRESLSALPSSVVDINSRFPDAGFYAFLNGPVLRPIFVSLLSSTDTRNRVIEVVDPSNPTTAESLNAVKRTDDASTAARNSGRCRHWGICRCWDRSPCCSWYTSRCKSSSRNTRGSQCWSICRNRCISWNRS